MCWTDQAIFMFRLIYLYIYYIYERMSEIANEINNKHRLREKNQSCFKDFYVDYITTYMRHLFLQSDKSGNWC